MPTYEWPAVFTDETFEYDAPDPQINRDSAVVDGLSGWAICMSGGGVDSPEERERRCGIPNNFGKGMVKIHKVLGVSPTPDRLEKMADERRNQ